MQELLDIDIMNLMEGLFAQLITYNDVFINDAQALCAIFMFLFFAERCYGMMTGDRQLEIMPLLRPFALAMVIIFWPSFVEVINFPGEIITDKSKGLLTSKLSTIDAIQLERREKLIDIGRRLTEEAAELDQFDQSKEENESIIAKLGIDLESVFEQIRGYYIIAIAKIRWMIMEIIEFLVISFFQICTYAVFFVQIIFGAILLILGPFTFAFSVLTPFKDVYLTWIARYFSVSIYTGLAYLIISIAMAIVQYGLEKELLLLDFVLNNDAAFFLYVTGNDGFSNIYWVALIVGGISMLTIPVISTWILNQGIAGAVQMAMRTGSKSITMAGSAAAA